MASLCFAMAVNEFTTWLRRSRKNGDIAFALICLGGTFFCLSCAGEYDVDFPAQSIPWLKAEVVAISLTAFALFWFFAEETKLIKKGYVLACLAWNLLVSASQLFDLGDLAWVSGRPFVMRVVLPFGLDFVYKEVDRGPLLVVADFVGFALFAYLAFVVAKFRRQGNRREAAVLFAVLGVIIAAEANDFFVGIGLYSFIFLMEYAWLAAILVVGLRRSNENMDAIRTKQALRKSDRDLGESQTMLSAIIDSTSDLIWSVDAASLGLLAYNRGLQDYVARKYGKKVLVGMRTEELFGSEGEIDFWNGAYARARNEGAYSIERNASVDSSVFQLSVNRMERGGEALRLLALRQGHHRAQAGRGPGAKGPVGEGDASAGALSSDEEQHERHHLDAQTAIARGWGRAAADRLRRDGGPHHLDVPGPRETLRGP